MLPIYALPVTILCIFLYRRHTMESVNSYQTEQGSKNHTETYSKKDSVSWLGYSFFVCGYLFLTVYSLIGNTELKQPALYLSLSLSILFYVMPILFMYLTSQIFKKRDSYTNKGKIINFFFTKS
ncbi:MAG: hypothetical protein ACI83D_000181 [Planctomycetota bacterium]|jgi:hypothetical protein